jgi:Ca2+/H+ antiporter
VSTALVERAQSRNTAGTGAAAFALQEPAVTTTIVLFLAFGACFGLATFSHRHLFSEGSSRANHSGDNDDTITQRAIWVASCSALWPLLAVTGVLSAWRLRRVRARSIRRDAQ